jgi:hypothetical protein
LTVVRAHGSKAVAAAGSPFRAPANFVHKSNLEETWLTGITGSFELLKARVARGRIGDLDRFITAAHGAAVRAAALTHRLLAFARRQALDPTRINANSLITDMMDMVQRTVGPGIRVKTTLMHIRPLAEPMRPASVRNRNSESVHQCPGCDA